MKLRFFGTGSGTEPIAGWHHSALALERDDGSLYWFDAGETSSYTAYLSGADLTVIRAVFISHTHLDHVGGLANLFWNIRKISRKFKHPVRFPRIDLFIPQLGTWEGVQAILRNTEGGFRCDFSIEAHGVADGVIFEENGVCVTALSNGHMEPGRSFSYRIEADGRSVVYSGDFGRPEELLPLCADCCDALLLETGHHSAESLCRFVAERGIAPGLLCFVHSGEELRADPEGMERRLREGYAGRLMIAREGDVLPL